MPLDAHVSESFSFVDKNCHADMVEDLFKKTPTTDKRLGLVFVTEHGKRDEKILGLISAWDIVD